MKGAKYEKISKCRGGGNLRLSIQGFRKLFNRYLFNYSKNFGFTLAEVLVTLGIIGVVSAMTVPTLMQNYQRKTYVTQLHKVYNELSQALLQYQTDRNAVNLREAGINSLNNTLSFINSYFKVVTDCGADTEPCFATEYHKLDGTKMDDERCNSTHPCLVLANGCSMSIYYPDGDVGPIFQVILDINGQQGPNIAGRDFFSFYIYNNGVIDDLATKDSEDSPNGFEWDASVTAPLSEEIRETNFNRGCMSNKPREWHGCFGKILNDNWEMNY